MPASIHHSRTTATTAPAPAIAWHTMAERDVLERLEASRDGLDTARALERQREFGPNVLPARKPPTAFAILLHQFLSPLIYILLAAGVVAIVMGDLTDALFIFGVVLLNAGLGAYQENKAERSAASLQQLLRIRAHVRRDGAQVARSRSPKTCPWATGETWPSPAQSCRLRRYRCRSGSYPSPWLPPCS